MYWAMLNFIVEEGAMTRGCLDRDKSYLYFFSI